MEREYFLTSIIFCYNWKKISYTWKESIFSILGKRLVYTWKIIIIHTKQSHDYTAKRELHNDYTKIVRMKKNTFVGLGIHSLYDQDMITSIESISFVRNAPFHFFDKVKK